MLSETCQSPYEATMAAVALAAFSVSKLKLISISVQVKGSEIDNNLGMMKSSIDGKQY